jgi:hypothetical protein
MPRLVQTAVDIDLRPLLDVTADKDHRNLVALRKRHDHPPLAAEVYDAQAFDLVALQVVFVPEHYVPPFREKGWRTAEG